MRVAIIDDEEECRKVLENYLDRYGEEHALNIRYQSFSDGIDLVSEYTADYDVVFLDIAMKHMDGMETARYIRKMDNKVMIVFVTELAEHAIFGYSVDATGFLLKPLSYEVFSERFSVCVEKLKRAEAKYMVFETDIGMDRIEINKILYIESEGHKMVIHTSEKEYYVYETMRNLENTLPKGQFSRCNHCYIVNLLHVKGIHGDFVSLGKEELKISRARRKQFMDDIADYFVKG